MLGNRHNILYLVHQLCLNVYYVDQEYISNVHFCKYLYVAKTLLSSDLFCCIVTFFDSCVTVALDPLQLLPLW